MVKRLLVLCTGRSNAPKEVAFIRNAFNFTDAETLFVDYDRGQRPDEVLDMGRPQDVAFLKAKYNVFDAVLLVNCGVYLTKESDPFQDTVQMLLSELVRPSGYLMLYPTASKTSVRIRNAFYEQYYALGEKIYRLVLQDPLGFVYKGRIGLQSPSGPYDLDLYERRNTPAGPQAPLRLRRGSP